MRDRLYLTMRTTENDGIIAYEQLRPEKEYVFSDFRSFYRWACEKTGEGQKPDSYTEDGRIVVNANKYEAMRQIIADLVAYDPRANYSINNSSELILFHDRAKEIV